MKRTIIWLIVLAAFALSVAMSWYFAHHSLPLPETPIARNKDFRGRSAPEFVATDLNGRHYSIRGLRGKVVVVHFWATWCGPCLAELPRIERDLWQANHGAVPVIAIARGETEQKIRAFNDSKNFTFPLVADPDKRIYHLFAEDSIPRTYVLDRNGTVVHQSVGYTPRLFAATVDAVDAAAR